MEASRFCVLFSVWDKERALPLARAMAAAGGELWASAGTCAAFQAAGLEVRSIESLTGFSNLLDGRIKTLHPAIFAGLLARPSDTLPSEIPRWEVLVVDWYPFSEGALDVEQIDIGGVSLLRAAAKNYACVWPIPGPAFYEEALELIQTYGGPPPMVVRYRYAMETFAQCARYEARIAQAFGAQPPLFATPLRYGENPHQQAFFLGHLPKASGHKPLSYNNLLDLHVGLQVVADWPSPACVILKHTQPCGAAWAGDLAKAYQKAFEANPVAAYGGVVVCNRPIDLPMAEGLQGHFIEVLAAPAFTPEAQTWLQQHKKALLVEIPSLHLPTYEVRTVLNGLLWQTTNREEEEEVSDLDLRWGLRVLRALYSNAVVIVAPGCVVAAAGGYPARIEAVQAALAQIAAKGLNPAELTLLSDGFFPFVDSLAAAHAAGIRRVVVPEGGKRQQELVEFAHTHHIHLTFLKKRYFRH
ncbi:MAG: hypothetical protein NZ958_01265 [Bacteroidia bacterium]|nr:hypothetical protein [Bacteroidia bacterium]MDW8089293.1 hypothetical protein [Bacteroidia bacterium]